MFNSAILKLTSFCNLNCTYCYMFNLEDQTHSRVPKSMPIATAIVALECIERHLICEKKDKFSLVLHGGEPTLWPVDNFSLFLNKIAEIRRNHQMTVSIQTNAYQEIDVELLELLDAHQVSIGISLDGPAEYNDAYRVDHRGKGSYERVIKNVSKIIEQGYMHLIGGFLTVAQPALPPKEFLKWASDLPVKRVSVLWPIDYNYNNLPWASTSLAEYTQHPRYGAWFTDLFIEWLRLDDPELYIRHFYDVIHRLMGSKQHTDDIGNELIDMVVINTDGCIEYPDYFRSYKDGGSRTPYNVNANELSDVVKDPVFSYCLDLHARLPQACTHCSCVDICGGGFLPGRMNQNELVPTQKSVLCYDQYYFFAHVQKILSGYAVNAASLV
ncbi:MAG: radical SAM protein [Caldilineaceae bacterium]|nr:radical SAM protein [Caldilineaceae bacterium]